MTYKVGPHTGNEWVSFNVGELILAPVVFTEYFTRSANAYVDVMTFSQRFNKQPWNPQIAALLVIGYQTYVKTSHEDTSQEGYVITTDKCTLWCHKEYIHYVMRLP